MALSIRSITRQSRSLVRSFTTPSLPSNSSSTPPPPINAEASSSSAVAEAYKVPRTANGELPVYSKLRRGNMWKTVVRNVEGDVGSLQADLNALFQQTHIDPLLPAPVVTVRPTNQHLEVKGRWVPQVKEWLEGRGF
ncbi:mitochondrial large subunit ribosomal protein-domain-containing protein [Dioszegia hungarica]|uniref:Large ribosomal subunit protein mL49 n=1 Tax=Dioszegia hungarica TaxID=4972 RepID=A0AA38H5T1_9TREE|nr:mitochondrial large subunit ribosomal protein-domain-containing protein [Dioszegia hungarica]KAI9634548.1 mitochondrial large subunit ribosomal protein-domain-containing protein [Dioszegia hungarica]